MPKKSELIQLRRGEILDAAVDVEPIWVNEFNTADAKTFCKDVMVRSAASKEVPILIYIDSYGGAVDALMSMMACLDSVANPIVCANLGKAMSCGSALLSHGDLRFVAPHSRTMIHEVSAGQSGHVNDISNSIEETKRLNVYLMDLLAKNCGLAGYEDLKKHLPTESRDLYLTPRQAVRFGIADRVGLPVLQKTASYALRVSSKL